MGNVGGGLHGPSDCLSVPCDDSLSTDSELGVLAGSELPAVDEREIAPLFLRAASTLSRTSRRSSASSLSLSPETDVTFSDGALSFSNVGLPTVNGACSCDGLLSAAITTYAGLCDTRIETGVPEVPLSSSLTWGKDIPEIEVPLIWSKVSPGKIWPLLLAGPPGTIL